MTLPQPSDVYPIGKTVAREVLNVPASSVGWRVTLSCDQFPDTGEEIRVNVYHSRDGGATHGLVRSVTFLASSKMTDKEGNPISEVWFGGEYPYQYDAGDEKGAKYRYYKATDFKVEIDTKVEVKTVLTIEAVDVISVRERLGIDPTYLLNGRLDQ